MIPPYGDIIERKIYYARDHMQRADNFCALGLIEIEISGITVIFKPAKSRLARTELAKISLDIAMTNHSFAVSRKSKIAQARTAILVRTHGVMVFAIENLTIKMYCQNRH